MTDFKPGEIVDIHIPGARVRAEEKDDDTGFDVLVVVHGAINSTLHVLLDPDVNVTCVAPAEWPPQIDDLWRDRLGTLWFGVEGVDKVRLVNSSSGQVSQDADYINQCFGQLALVHREDGSET